MNPKISTEKFLAQVSKRLKNEKGQYVVFGNRAIEEMENLREKYPDAFVEKVPCNDGVFASSELWLIGGRSFGEEGRFGLTVILIPQCDGAPKEFHLSSPQRDLLIDKLFVI